MSDARNLPDVNFVSTDVSSLENAMISAYERMTGKTLYPGSPERIFVLWATDIVVQLRVLINESARQNVPSSSNGAYLDNLAQLFNRVSRRDAQPATTTIRFYLSAAQPQPQLVPRGTRVTVDGSITFSTTADIYIPAGSLYVDVPAMCDTAGVSGNGYAPGQVKQLVDLFPYFERCENTTTSEGGSEVESDDELYRRMRESEDSYSTAGPQGGYIYYAKAVSTLISDVVAWKSAPGCVSVAVLMEGGHLPGTEMLAAVTAALSDKTVRPLTDSVTVVPPSTVKFNIDLTYYIPAESAESAATVEGAVATAVAAYKSWQCEKMGRDINPSKLTSLLMAVGVKRVDIRSPVYASVVEGSVAQLGSESVINGGYESE